MEPVGACAVAKPTRPRNTAATTFAVHARHALACDASSRSTFRQRGFIAQGTVTGTAISTRNRRVCRQGKPDSLPREDGTFALGRCPLPQRKSYLPDRR